MRRRDFTMLLAGAGLAWSRTAAGQDRMRRIGMLMQFAEGNPQVLTWLSALREGLQAFGWVEGRNVSLEFRWAGNDVNATQKLAKEVVALRPDLIFSSGSPTTRALVQETSSIPIIFGNLVDPVGQGFVTSLAQPGGNITGFVNLEASITGKYLELLKEIAPRINRVTLFFNPSTAIYSEIYIQPFKTAAATHGIEPLVAPIQNMAELESVMAAEARTPNGGMMSMPDGFTNAYSADIAALSVRYRLPTIHQNPAAARAGVLLSYGNDITDNYRRAAGYVNRILKGEKPSDLPVQFPVKFLLAINLRTAKTLGLEVPLFLQQRADEVIE